MAGTTTGIFGSATFDHKRFGIGEIVETYSEDIDSDETFASEFSQDVTEDSDFSEASSGEYSAVFSEDGEVVESGTGAYECSVSEDLDSAEILVGTLEYVINEILDFTELTDQDITASEILSFVESVLIEIISATTEALEFAEVPQGEYASSETEDLDSTELPSGELGCSSSDTLDMPEAIAGEYDATFTEDGDFTEGTIGGCEASYSEELDLTEDLTLMIVLLETVVENLDYTEDLTLLTIKVVTVIESLEFVETSPNSMLIRFLMESLYFARWDEEALTELEDSASEVLLLTESEEHLMEFSVTEAIDHLETLGSLYIAEIRETVGDEEIIPGEAVWTTASDIVSFTESCLSALHAIPVSDSIAITENQRAEIASGNIENIIFTESWSSLFSMGYIENLIFTDNWAEQLTFKYAKCKKLQCKLSTPKVINLLCRICVRP